MLLRGVVHRRHLVGGTDRRLAAQRGECHVAEERDDRVDVVGQALQVEADQHLAHIRRHVAADHVDPGRHGDSLSAWLTGVGVTWEANPSSDRRVRHAS